MVENTITVWIFKHPCLLMLLFRCAGVYVVGAVVAQGRAKANLDVVCCSAAWFNLDFSTCPKVSDFYTDGFQNESPRWGIFVQCSLAASKQQRYAQGRFPELVWPQNVLFWFVVKRRKGPFGSWNPRQQRSKPFILSYIYIYMGCFLGFTVLNLFFSQSWTKHPLSQVMPIGP